MWFRPDVWPVRVCEYWWTSWQMPIYYRIIQNPPVTDVYIYFDREHGMERLPRAWHNPISSYNRWWMLSSAGDENHQPGCTNISDLGMDCAVSLSFDGLEYFSVGIHLLCCKNSGTTGKCYYWIFGKNKEKSPEAMQSCQPCWFYIFYTNSRVVSWITDTHMFNSLWNYSWQRRWFIVSMHWNVFVNNYRIKNTDRLYFWS